MAEFRRLADAHASGRWLPEHRIGRANLIAAFPEKSPAEIEAILRGVWDNLGRVGAEFAHLDRLWDYDPAHPERTGRIDDHARQHRSLLRLQDDGKPALIFAAHLANWELPAICARDLRARHRRALPPAQHRRPSTAGCDRTRAGCMGTLIPTGLDAPVKLAAALERGAHVGMLVDQYYVRGVRGDVLRPPDQGQSADRAARPPRRLPDPRHRAWCACPATASAPR